MTAVAMRLVARDIPDATRCIVYTRVSTDHQAKADRASLAEQERLCREHAARLGYPDAELWKDSGRSGRDGRRLEDLTTWCEAHPRTQGKRGLVVTWAVDRYSRLEIEEALYYKHRLRKAGWDLEYESRKRTGDAFVDGLGESLDLLLGRRESDIKRDRVLRDMPKYAERGRWLGGKPPLGYDKGPDGKLVRNSDAAKVRRLFEQYADGASYAALAATFELGPTTVQQVLDNPVYTGAIVWARRKGSQADRVEMPNAHDAIVSPALWQRVRARRCSRSKPHGRPTRGYWASGLVTCQCGHGLSGGGGVAKNASPDERERKASYRCKHCLGSGGSRIGAQWLESELVKLVASHVVKSVQSGAFAKALARVLKAEHAEPDMAHQLDVAKTRKARLIRLAAQTDDADVAAEIKAIRAEITRLEQAQEAKPDTATVKREVTQAVNAIEDLPALLARATPVQVQEALRPWIAAAVLDRKAGTLTVQVNVLPILSTARPGPAGDFAV